VVNLKLKPKNVVRAQPATNPAKLKPKPKPPPLRIVPIPSQPKQPSQPLNAWKLASWNARRGATPVTKPANKSAPQIRALLPKETPAKKAVVS
jgi:hypothetical protein